MFNLGSFTTSTPVYKQHESGFYENSPQSRNLSQVTFGDALESNCTPLRKNLFGKRRSNGNADCLLSNEQKLFLSRSSTFSRRDSNSSKETPRTSRIYKRADKPVHLTNHEIPWRPWSTTSFKQLDENDSGFCNETPERSGNYESLDSSRTPLTNLSNIIKENSQRNPAYLNHAFDFFGAKNCDDLSTSELCDLYSMYRFEKMGIKPSAADNAFEENNMVVDEGSSMGLLSWKEELECISANAFKEPKINFLLELYKRNAYLIVSNILSYLSGSDLQNASHVDRLWRKLILDDKAANRTRCTYLLAAQLITQEKKKKSNPFQRPPNFRILGSIENIQNKQLHLNKTNKERNFQAFIENGKSGKNHKPMKCPSCANLSLQNGRIITKYNCMFCDYDFCCNCLKPYTSWHSCSPVFSPAVRPSTNGKKYLRRL